MTSLPTANLQILQTNFQAGSSLLPRYPTGGETSFEDNTPLLSEHAMHLAHDGYRDHHAEGVVTAYVRFPKGSPDH